jgi:hypothetical protein
MISALSTTRYRSLSPMLPYVAALDPGLLILAPVPGITAVLPRFLGLS